MVSNIPACEKNLAFLLNDLEQHLESTNEAVKASYFRTGSSNPNIPERAGYYVGYLVAKEISRQFTPTAMVRLQRDTLIPLIRKALQTLKAQIVPKSKG